MCIIIKTKIISQIQRFALMAPFSESRLNFGSLDHLTMRHRGSPIALYAHW